MNNSCIWRSKYQSMRAGQYNEHHMFCGTYGPENGGQEKREWEEPIVSSSTVSESCRIDKHTKEPISAKSGKSRPLSTRTCTPGSSLIACGLCSLLSAHLSSLASLGCLRVDTAGKYGDIS